MPVVSAQPDTLTLDTARYELRRGERVLRLEKIPMELLILLALKKDQLVGRQEIIETIWGKGTFLDTEQGINTAIRKIRLVLRDDPSQPRFLQTVVGKGYRFIGPIALVGNGGGDTAALAEMPEAVGDPSPRRRPWTTIIVLTGLAVSITLLIASGGVGPGRQDLGSEPTIRSIAVLPLENVSGDHEQDYLADGLTDALLTNLAQVRSLRVSSQTSSLQYRGSHKGLPEIAKELSVDAVVEGTFARAGNRVRITVQLIHAATDRHLWTESYERDFEDVLSLQSAIALNIAREISATLSSREQLHLARTSHVVAEAQEAYLRGRYLLNLRSGEDMRRALYYFQLAVDKDTTFAEAYAGLAESYYTLAGWGLVKGLDAKMGAAAMKAVELDASSSGAHVALAAYKYNVNDYEGMRRELTRALELNPNNSTAHKLYGFYLMWVGDIDAASAEMLRAKDLDPLAAHLSLSLGCAFYDANQFDRAVSQWQRAMELDPNLHFLHLNIGWAYAHQGQHEAAVREWSRHWKYDPATSRILAAAYHRSGYQGYLRAQLGSKFTRAFKPESLSDYNRAVIYTELEEKDQAFDFLAKALQHHDADLVASRIDPDLEKLRSDPRFHDFVMHCGTECGARRRGDRG